MGDQVGEVDSDKGGHGLAMALETKAAFQLIGHELKVGWLLQRQELLEEPHGFSLERTAGHCRLGRIGQGSQPMSKTKLCIRRR